MKIRWKRGQMIVAILCVMLLAFTAACGDDDDDGGDAETPAATSTATTGSAQSDSTPTEAEEEEAEATETTGGASATATEAEDEDDPTATTGTQATATVAATESSATSTATTASGDPTATTSSGEPTTDTGTGGTGDLPDVETLDPELLPNFSMSMNFEATNFSGTPQTTLQMQMEQSAIDHYHFLMVAEGEEIEFWTIGEQSWTSLAGEVIESPTGPLFSPGDLLETGELIPEGLNAREEGTEEVNGRQTTKWVVDGADYVAFMNEQAQTDATSTIEMTNGAGEVAIWIDNELNIMIKAEGDVTWDNSDDTQGSLIYDYEIFDIGSTADVVAPV